MCYAERRYTSGKFMAWHRRFVFDPASDNHGQMITCSGSGKPVLPPVTSAKIRRIVRK